MTCISLIADIRSIMIVAILNVTALFLLYIYWIVNNLNISFPNVSIFLDFECH